MDDQERVLWYLIVGTRGGPTRLQLLAILQKRPCNTNQLAQIARLDYKTVKRHLEILEENGLVAVSSEKRYGELYHLTDFANSVLKSFDDVLRKLGGDLG